MSLQKREEKAKQLWDIHVLFSVYNLQLVKKKIFLLQTRKFKYLNNIFEHIYLFKFFLYILMNNKLKYINIYNK